MKASQVPPNPTSLLDRVSLNLSMREQLLPENFGRMRDECTWVARFELDAEGEPVDVGEVIVHRMPLYNDKDLAEEAEQGDWVSGNAVAAVVDFCQLKDSVSDILHRARSRDEDEWSTFLVVETPSLIESWLGHGIESLFLASALARLDSLADLIAVAEPIPWWLEGDDRKRAREAHLPAFKALGFKKFKQGTWLLADPSTVPNRLHELRAKYPVLSGAG